MGKYLLQMLFFNFGPYAVEKVSSPTRLLLTETVDLEMILQKHGTYFVAVVLYPNFKLIHGFIK